MKLIFVLLVSILYMFGTDFNPQNIVIKKIDKKTAVIDKGNLTIGKSGIVVHYFKDKKQMILTNAIVIKTTNLNSVIKFVDTKLLLQDAIPTTKLKPAVGDIFVLNHLYYTSLLITPNFEAQNTIKQKYNKNNFIDINIFAATLRINNIPIPTQEDIRGYALKNNIGTIFFYLNQYLYIVDTISFKVIDKQLINIKDKSKHTPFFTNVQNIKSGLFSFGKDKIDNFDKYYLNMLGIKNDRK